MSELRECPRCMGSVSLQRFNVHPSLKARIICSCGIEMRASKRDSVEDLIERWNTRAERTCENTSMKSDQWACSECGGNYDIANIDLDPDEDSGIPSYCPNCGAKVVVE